MKDLSRDYQRIKRRIFEIIQIGETKDLPSRLFDLFLCSAIILNILILYVETFTRHRMLRQIDHMCFYIFLVEFILRLWTAEFLYEKKGSKPPWLRYILSFNGMVELLTLISYRLYSGFVVLRLVRVIRIFRLFKVNAYHDAFSVIEEVLKKKRRQLSSAVFLVSILAMFSSLVMYNMEHEAQPEVFKNAFSGIWWAVSTLLTVGYGDIYPVTIPGRICGIIIACLGVGMVAIPTGIISAGFVEIYQSEKEIAGDGEGGYFTGVEIGKGHSFIGLRVFDINMSGHADHIGAKQGSVVAAVLRGKSVIVPDDDFVIKEKDRVLFGDPGGSKPSL